MLKNILGEETQRMKAKLDAALSLEAEDFEYRWAAD
jgi:hypothetical protein